MRQNIENRQLYPLNWNKADYLTFTLKSEPSFSTSAGKLVQLIACERRWGVQNAGGGDQTFQREYLGLIDSITWSTNLEIGTPICLGWQINLFPVSEEEWNEFQNPVPARRMLKYLHWYLHPVEWMRVFFFYEEFAFCVSQLACCLSKLHKH